MLFPLSPFALGAIRLLLGCVLFVFTLQSRAQNAPPEKPKVTRILFLLDASGSMMAPWEGKPRWEVAKRLLAKMADSLNAYPNLELGLHVNGHQRLLLTQHSGAAAIGERGEADALRAAEFQHGLVGAFIVEEI